MVVFENIQIKSSSGSRYYAEACNQWRGRSSRRSAWAAQKASQQWQAVVDSVQFDRLCNRTQSSPVPTTIRIFLTMAIIGIELVIKIKLY